jgi:predicted acyl esterase
MGGGDGRRNADGRMNHGGRWREEQEWPLARTLYVTYYLRADGRLTIKEPVEEEPPSAVVFDPEHPVPTIGGTVTGFIEIPRPEDGGPMLNPVPPFLEQRATVKPYERQIVQPGPMHQKERPGFVGCRYPYPLLADRPDVLVFQTEVLDADVEITGTVEVKLWVSSSAVDTDFTVKLLDVYPASDDWPEGFHMNLADTILRCRYRKSWTEPEMMEPGKVCPIVIKLPPISNLFRAGHCIRLDVSSSNFPRFDVNPNTGEPMGRHTHLLIAENKVHLGGATPSHIILPVVSTA